MAAPLASSTPASSPTTSSWRPYMRTNGRVRAARRRPTRLYRSLEPPPARDRAAGQREDDPAPACRGRGAPGCRARIAVLPVVFAEESYDVATAGEFWLECLTNLAGQAPRRDDAPDLHRTIEELRAVRDDRALADRCLGALLDFADRENKRLLLLVENLNMLFRDMAHPDEGWRLRKTLQTEPRIIVFASATSRFDEIDHPDRALYDLFRTRTLRPLDTNQCSVLWRR